MNYSNAEQFYEGINIVFDLYTKYGDNDYIGEEVTQLEHALQCAHQASIEFPDNLEIILGAFLHDIGHLLSIHDSNQGVEDKLIDFDNKSLNGLGLVNHENIGADFLEKMGFPKSVSSLGRNHVIAKRYLITKDGEYLNNLSDASKETFKLQGGVLSNIELSNFELDKEHPVFIRMRHWDDMAKDTEFNYQRNISFYRDMAVKLLITKNHNL